MRNINGAWKLAGQGTISATTGGVDIPVIETIPAKTNLFVYAVTVSNAGSGIAYYTEPEARGGTANQGEPVPNTSPAGTVSVEFGPRDLQDVVDKGNPQMRSGTGTVVVRYRIYVQSR
jgi:hypothetical protein